VFPLHDSWELLFLRVFDLQQQLLLTETLDHLIQRGEFFAESGKWRIKLKFFNFFLLFNFDSLKFQISWLGWA